MMATVPPLMLRLKLIFVLFVASLVSAQVKLPLSSEVSTSLVKFPSIWPALLSEDALTVTMNSSSTTLDELADSNDRALLRRLLAGVRHTFHPR